MVTADVGYLQLEWPSTEARLWQGWQFRVLWISLLPFTSYWCAIDVNPGGTQTVPVFANPGDLHYEAEKLETSLVLIAAHAHCESVRILPKSLGLFRIVAVGPQDVVGIFAV